VSQRNTFYAVDEVANAIASHYNILPENVRSILFQLVDNPYSDKSVANAIMYNFDNLDEKVRNKFLFELSEYIYRHKDCEFIRTAYDFLTN
jgi:hypothetical protein